MKLRFLSTLLFMAIGLSVAVPGAWGLSLSRIDWSQTPSSYTSAEFWDPFDWIGLTGAGTPKIYSSSGGGAKSILSASAQNVVSWWQVWAYGSTQEAWSAMSWTDTYRLTGDPGQYAAVTLDYDLSYNRTNYAFDGRSMTNANAWMAYAINREPTSTDYGGKMDEGYGKSIYFLGLTWDDGHLTGSLPFGSLGVGDTISLLGYHSAKVQAQAYGPAVTGAVMVSSFEYSLGLTETSPVPEPASILLFGAGLAGLAAVARRKKS